MTRFAGTVSIVTGGASGIGLALGKALVAQGGVVVLADIDGEGAAQQAAALGDKAQGVALDVTDAAAVAAVVAAAREQHGKLDLMFNNAGIGVLGELRDMTLGDWERVLKVNVMGVVHGVQAAYPLMIEQGHGHIVNTASLAGLCPAPGLGAYSASKHAVVGLSRTLRAEARDLGVKVSAACPGIVQTPILERSETRGVDGNELRKGLMFGAITPEACAKQILKGVRKNRELIVITRSAKVGVFLQKFFPWLLNLLVNVGARKVRETRKG